MTLEGILGYGLELRRNVSNSNFNIGFSVEYLNKVEKFLTTKSTDGFWSVPIEITICFYLPITTEKYKIFIGAGMGLYMGERCYSFEDFQSEVIDSKNGYGIHIQSGLDYILFKQYGVRAQIKFRDVQFKSTNKFNTHKESKLDTKPFTSQINIDGMVIDVSFIYYF